ncbi:hypothetical protein QBX67_28120, partial [Bacillus sp. LS15-K4]|nr:hypothetical protein [Bacillus sp. LS15-K4]
IRGHAVECRINAEDPERFLPCPGKIERFHAPGGMGVRWESHIYSGYTVPAHFDVFLFERQRLTRGDTQLLFD